MRELIINDTKLQILNAYEDTTYEGIEEGVKAIKNITDISFVLMEIKTIEEKDVIPMNHNRKVIDSIHSFLSDKQGLIDVKNGKTKNGCPFVYSLVKTVEKDGGCQYTLTLDIKVNDVYVELSGFGQEIDNFGNREVVVMDRLNNSDKLTQSMLKRWNEDPFDKDFKRGSLMNYAERVEFDSLFPKHPLSMLRRFVNAFLDNN